MSQTIILLVGDEQVPFIVHQKILCENSPFFESACKPEWMKDEQTIKLPVDEPELIDIVVYCKSFAQ
jgi:hypothetical protein